MSNIGSLSQLGWTGWITAWSSGQSYIKYAKCGGVVTVTGTSYGNYPLSGMTASNMCTLPPNYRPGVDIKSAGTPMSSSGKEIQVSIGIDGVIAIFGLGSNTAYWGFTVSYPVGYSGR